MNKHMIIYIVGIILITEGAFMLLPCLVALIYQEAAGYSFLVTAFMAMIIGFLLRVRKPKNTVMYAREGFVIVALSWVVLSLIGAVPFTLSGEIPGYLDAVFECVSGFTTTGATILTDVEALSHCSLFWRSFTHWLGGMGVLVFVLAILPMTGGQTIHLLRAESPGPSVSKMVPKMRTSSMILYSIYLIMTAIQIVFYLIGGMPVFDAICLAFGTAGTGGFSIRNTGLNGYSMYLQGVTTVFMILFGVNFSIYFFILRKKFKLAVENEELRCYLGIIFVAVAIISVNTLYHGGYFDSVLEAVHHSAFAVASVITTTGYGTVDFNEWPELSRVVLVLLMIVGASAGSTGGGMKVSRVIILFKSALAELRKELHPHSVQVIKMDGKKLPKETVQGVGSYLVIYVILIGISVLLVSMDNFDMETTVTSVLATINNIGPGLGLVGPTGNFSMFSPLAKIVLTLDMLFGRLEFIPMMILFLPETWRRKG